MCECSMVFTYVCMSGTGCVGIVVVDHCWPTIYTLDPVQGYCMIEEQLNFCQP